MLGFIMILFVEKAENREPGFLQVFFRFRYQRRIPSRLLISVGVMQYDVVDRAGYAPSWYCQIWRLRRCLWRRRNRIDTTSSDMIYSHSSSQARRIPSGAGTGVECGSSSCKYNPCRSYHSIFALSGAINSTDATHFHIEHTNV